VLACTGFGDDALFPHALGQQSLAESVVDLVRAGVEQVFALKVDFGAAELFGEPFAEIERCGAAGVVLKQICQLRLKSGIVLGRVVFMLKLDQRGHQRLRHVAAAVDAEAAGAQFEGTEGRLIDAICRGLLLSWPKMGNLSVYPERPGRQMATPPSSPAT